MPPRLDSLQCNIFLVESSLVQSANVQQDLERAAQTVKAKQPRSISKGVDIKAKYWLKWGDVERRECVDIYVKCDMKGIQLHYGTPHPPPLPNKNPFPGREVCERDCSQQSRWVPLLPVS